MHDEHSSSNFIPTRSAFNHQFPKAAFGQSYHTSHQHHLHFIIGTHHTFNHPIPNTAALVTSLRKTFSTHSNLASLMGFTLTTISRPSECPKRQHLGSHPLCCNILTHMMLLTSLTRRRHTL